ncbi:hypothetical protein Stsp01_66610 [Streptomyces sp. NBRC 13847]|nr:hypothetical protein Stsp01_66610 [Streptomyces sp. NBRC 13847]
MGSCVSAVKETAFTEKLHAACTTGGLMASRHLTENQTRDPLTGNFEMARSHCSRHSFTITASVLSAGAGRPLHLKGRP